MSFIQKLVVTVLPQRLSKAMEAESRAWVAECSCGHTRTVWELGGIRYKASGEPRWVLDCPQCGQRSAHRVYHKP